MMYPLITLSDNSVIVHSEMIDCSVKVYIEKPDEKDCFHNATCWLPQYRWDGINGFSQNEIMEYQKIIESMSHLILRFAKEGGLENASGF